MYLMPLAHAFLTLAAIAGMCLAVSSLIRWMTRPRGGKGLRRK